MLRRSAMTLALTVLVKPWSIITESFTFARVQSGAAKAVREEDWAVIFSVEDACLRLLALRTFR